MLLILLLNSSWEFNSCFQVRLQARRISTIFSVGENASPTSFLTKRFQAPILSLDELPRVDVINISHDHYDHLDRETIEYFSQKGTNFIVPLGIGEKLEEFGVARERIRELDWNESHRFKDLDFTATTAHHTSGRGVFDQKKTLWASWVVKGKNQSIFYSGDTGYKGHFKKIGEVYGPFDVAFIENGQYDVKWPEHHMQPEESIQAAFDVGAKAFVPVHWGMFDLSLHHWSEPVLRSSKIARERGMPYYSPLLGQIVDTNQIPEFTDWWEEVLRKEAELLK